MSSYPPSDSGSDFDSLSKIQQISLLMNPKALQAWSYVQDMRQKKEQRDHQKQIFQMELEDRSRRRAHEDFATQVTLQGMGALPVHPGVEGKFEAGLGGRGTITAPNNQQYSLPSESQRYERSKSAAAQAGTLKGIEQKATEDVSQPYESIDVPTEMGGGTAQVKKSEKLQKLLDLYKTAHPHRAYHSTTPNDKGDVTIWSVDPANGDVRTERTLTGAGKTKSAGDEGIPDFDARVKSLMDQWRPGHYAQLGITQAVQDAAKKVAGPLGDGNPAAGRIHQAEDSLYKRAVDSLKNSSKTDRPGVTMSPVPTKKMNPADEIKRVVKLGKPMPAKNVAAAAKGLGITEEEFSRLWHVAGGTITP